MPIYRRRRLSKRTRSRSVSVGNSATKKWHMETPSFYMHLIVLQSFRVPIDPRVLRLRYSSSNHQHANIIRPLLQLVERQNSTLATLPRIRQARSDMEKKLEELSKRLEIFSELNDAYQALIDNLKGVQHDQMEKIEHLQATIDRLLKEQQQARSGLPAAAGGGVAMEEEEESVPVIEPPSTCPLGAEDVSPSSSADASSMKVLAIAPADFDEVAEADDDGDQPQLETEIIYDFVV